MQKFLLRHRFWTTSVAAFAMVFGLGMSADGQVVTDIINDSFVDGDPVDNGLPLESRWFYTSSGSALDDGPQTPGVLDFASGTSGRAIHSIFAAQSLALVGDKLTGSIDYVTPATVGTGEDIRFGFFDTSTSPGFSATGNNPNGFADNITASSSSAEPGLNIAGFSGGADINDAGTGDLEYRFSDTANGTGRLLTTTGGFSNIGFGTDDGTDMGATAVAPNTAGNIMFMIENIGGGQVELTQTLFGETFTRTANAADTGTTFDFIGLSVTSGAFGSVNSVGEPDNGLDITNVTVQFTTTASAIPEPSSVALLGLGCVGLFGRRRRR